MSTMRKTPRPDSPHAPRPPVVPTVGQGLCACPALPEPHVHLPEGTIVKWDPPPAA